MKYFLKKPWVQEALGYGLVVVLLFRRAIIPPSGWLLFGDDIHRAYYFFREFFNHWMSLGVFPWWNPYLFGGMPFIADPIVNIWYPVNWLFFVFPLTLAYSWHVAIHLVWAGLGMSTLVNSVTKGNAAGTKNEFNIAGWVSGLVFMCSGFFMARTWSGHVDVIAAASWMPWVVWAFMRVIRPNSVVLRREEHTKDIVIASVVFACQLFSGYQTMAFMTVIIVGLLVVGYAISKRRFAPIVRAIGAGGMGLALAAVHIVPVQEFFRSSIRTYTLPYSWISYGSWTIKSLVLLLSPFFFGDQRVYHGPPPNFGEHSAFVGVTGLSLAIIGIVSLLKQRSKNDQSYRRVFGVVCLAVTILGVWMSLGPNAPIDLQYFAWKYIPIYRYLRIPPRHLVLVVFGLSGLAGLGMQYIVNHFSRLMRWVSWGIGGATLIEMMVFGSHFIELQPIPETRHDTALIHEVTKDKEPYRLLQNFGAWLPARDALDFDSVMSYGIFSVTGYSPSIYRPYYEYIARQTGTSGERAMPSYDIQVPYLSANNADAIDFLNVKYILVPPLYDPFAGNTRYTNILENTKKEFRLYENTTVLPRFYLKDRGCGEVNIQSYTPNTIVLSLESTCDTTLMSSEVWYPGWSAKVDGKNTNIDKLYDVFRTLPVQSGKHTIIYTYQPIIFGIGGAISLCTVMLLWYLLKRSYL